MQWRPRKHHTAVPRSALSLFRLRIQPLMERATPHILTHVVTTTDDATPLDFSLDEIETLIEKQILVNDKLKQSHLSIGAISENRAT